jgi:hypothetical protein
VSDEEVLTGEEVVIGEVPAQDTEREIWVYDPRDDFKITIPAGARMTFGYFNPAAAGVGGQTPRYGYQDGQGAQSMKTTCLRVYADSTDKRQIAAFLGIVGFRDVTLVKKTLLKRRVTIEINHEDDGNGKVEEARKQLASGAAVDEDELF